MNNDLPEPLASTPLDVLDRAQALTKANSIAVEDPYGLRFRPKCATAIGRSHPTTPGWITPQVNSADPRYLDFLVTLATEAEKAFPERHTDTGFVENGVTKNFSTLRSLPDVAETPASLAPLDNAMIREAAGLVHDFASAEDRQLAETVLELFYGAPRWRDGRFVLKSTLSEPTCTNNYQVKLETLFRMLRGFPRVMSLLTRADWAAAYREFGILKLHHLLFRLQSDGWSMNEAGLLLPKVREVFVMTKGGKIVTSKADKFKPLSLLGIDHAGICAKRHRLVFGASGALGLLGSILIQQWRYNAYEDFPFTLHHTTAVAMTEKVKALQPEWVQGGDVSKHDNFHARFYFDFWIAYQRANTMGDLVDILGALMFAPYVAPQRELGGKPFFSGNPLDPKVKQMLGLPSGLPHNPELGRDWMVFVYLEMAHRLIPDLYTWRGTMKESVAAFLRGEHPDLALICKTDDFAFIGPKGTRITRAMCQKVLDQGSPYMIIAQETSLAFLGNVGFSSADGQFSHFGPSTVTALANGFSPEGGMRISEAGNWALGVLARTAHYSVSPYARDAFALADDVWRFHMPEAHTLRAMAALIDPGFDPTGLDELTLRAIVDPGRLRWGIRPEDVPQELLDKHTGKVDLKHFRSLFEPYVKG